MSGNRSGRAIPTGTITFLFTDIEGSTRRWEQQPREMKLALQHHDQLLRSTIEANGGYVFKTVGDAFCAAFASAPQALQAALAAQLALNAGPESKVPSIESVEGDQRLGTLDSGLTLRVRMALHTGTAEEWDGDYFGPPVNRVARLLSAGHGGQTLLSLPTYELVRDELPDGVQLLDFGERRLKDLIRPERVFQVVASDLPADFPPLKTLDARPNNLPAQPTPLIGREKELMAVADLMRKRDTRLLTLTGPGGTGKTRLSLQVAADMVDEFDDGVYFVNLAPLSDPNLVVSTIAQVLGVKESGSQPLLDSLKDHLREKQLLLLLDNFEQVVEAASSVADLMAAAPRLKILVTSRVSLRLRGEHEYSVPPLQLPNPKQLPPLERLTQYEAVRLFIERARAVKADFEVNNDNAPAIAEICARLDGLPLAIELAAARIRLLPPQAMLARLESRLKLLTGGARDLPARQQTLRNAIEWSYDLLDDAEKRLFRRLAVFVGGRTLEAIEAVCNAEGDLGMDVLEGVESLLSKSLLRQEEGVGGEPRLVMLETIHEYAREKLEESEEAEALRGRHSSYFLAFSEDAEPQLRGPRQLEWLNRFEDEHDNLRAALQWSLIPADQGTYSMAPDAEVADVRTVVGLRLGAALWRYWDAHDYLSEGRRWLVAILAHTEGQPPAISRSSARAWCLCGAGLFALLQGDIGEARLRAEEAMAVARAIGHHRSLVNALIGISWIESLSGGGSALVLPPAQEALEVARQASDKWLLALATYGLGEATRVSGNDKAAVELHKESVTLFRQLGDKWYASLPLITLGETAVRYGEYKQAEAFFREALALSQEVGNRGSIAEALKGLGKVAYWHRDYSRAGSLYEEAVALGHKTGAGLWLPTALLSLGTIALMARDYEKARARYAQSLQISQEQENKRTIAIALMGLGNVANSEGDTTRATDLFRESLAIASQIGDDQAIADSIAGLGRVATRQGQSQRAASLLGASEAHFESTGYESKPAMFTFSSHELRPAKRMEYELSLAAAHTETEEAIWQKAWAEGRAMTLDQAIDYALEET